MTLWIYKIHPNFPKYRIYPDGRVFSIISNKFLKPGNIGRQNSTSFYKSLCIKNKQNQLQTVRIHRLIAEVFLPNPLKLPVVNHIDGNKGNNVISNLEWTTYTENNLHALKFKLKIPKAKILDLKPIFEDFLSKKYFIAELEEKYNWHTSYGLIKYLKKYAIQQQRLNEFVEAYSGIRARINTRTKSIQVNQYTSDGIFIKQYPSIQAAGKAVSTSKWAYCCIANCCKRKQNLFKGFKWKYA